MCICSIFTKCCRPSRAYDTEPLATETPAPAHRQPVTQDEARDMLHYAFAAPAIDSNQWREWLEPSGYAHIEPKTLPTAVLPGTVEARGFCFFDPETGLKLALFRKGSQILVTFGALSSYVSEVDRTERGVFLRKVLRAACYNLFWNRPLIFQRAHELVENIRALPEFHDLEIILTGQSFGGGVASYVALKTDLQAFCFNALSIGPWIEADVGRERLTLATRKITHLTVESDWLSDHCLAKAAHRLPAVIPSPSMPGRRLFLRTAYPRSSCDTHINIVGSLLAYTGFGLDDKPADVVPRLPRPSPTTIEFPRTDGLT